VKMC